ncbi:MAG: Lipid A biosynthesis acyltransferase [candidate division TA06 bacterium 32_111]|uniref:Lipid A biosynthesis acyltransferase n=2 Tax=Bacteria candidate phyla TaxID=1783234 RepID=A0A117M770_UNCT6|nr:MAG: Lipid A biosynthesis acyltransferase [candidate division TA06 bacterium 32_111]KUK88136.1 MAG: Lipid A biosynthesis acyltransferase [candidate division TA06 bacterium 34_109]HAF07066.1 hypothetical protein [candidate division WOR-3 bacterium]HCP16981.1 hypothetical protein [candidate division WOR-3 bacterium]
MKNGMKNLKNDLVVKISLFLLKYLPLRLLIVLAKLISILFYNFGIKSKKRVKENLKKCHIRFSIKIYLNNAQFLVENLYLFYHHPSENRFEFHNLELLENLLRKNEKVSIISVHYGNWEVVGQILQRKGFKISIVYQKRDEWFYHYIDNIRVKYGVKLIEKSSPLSVYKEQIENGRILSFLIDQKLNNITTKNVNFLGIVQNLPYGWYRLIEIFKLHPVLMVTRYERGKHKVYFYDAYSFPYEKIYRFFENHIRKDIFQYDFFSKIFQDSNG